MAEEEVLEQVPASSRSYKQIIIVVIVLALGGGIGAAVAMVAKNKAGPAYDKMGDCISIAGLIVNLMEPGGNRYLKVSMVFEIAFKDEALMKMKMKPRLKDQVLVYLSSLTVAQVLKREAKVKVKKEILKLANKVLGAGAVRQVYFRSFVIQ